MNELVENKNISEFEKYYEKIDLPSFNRGEIVQGRVVEITKKFVAIDIGSKTEGYADIKEFLDEKNNLTVKVGSRIEVLILGNDPDGGGLKLSKTLADRQKAINKIEDSFKNKTPIEGKITSRIKGGMIVDLGLKAFLPASHVDIRISNDMDKYIGLKAKFYVTEYNPKKQEVVVSRRLYLEDERKRLKDKTLQSLEVGKVFDGEVKSITDFGAFVDIGGIEGLLHVSDISWGKIKHPSEILKVWDKVKVKVLAFNKEKEKISLGIKQLTESPWNSVEERYPIGLKVQGTVTGVTDFGAFVEVEPGVEGLIKLSDMFWGKKFGKPSSILKVGDRIEVVVLDRNSKDRRMSLGLKQLLPNPMEELALKYPTGTKIRGKIKGITDFGLFVEIEDGYEGLVHILDVSWSKRVKNLNEIYKVGDEIDVVVLKIDPEREKISLGIKQLTSDPWKRAKKEFKPGNNVKAKVVSVEENIVRVDLGDGLEGIIPFKEINQKEDEIRSNFNPGTEIEAKVIELDIKNERIVLSIKLFERETEKKELEKYINTESATTSLGDLLLSTIKDNKKKNGQ
jgi:small subunit ribosomal protein S1